MFAQSEFLAPVSCASCLVSRVLLRRRRMCLQTRRLRLPLVVIILIFVSRDRPAFLVGWTGRAHTNGAWPGSQPGEAKRARANKRWKPAIAATHFASITPPTAPADAGAAIAAIAAFAASPQSPPQLDQSG